MGGGKFYGNKIPIYIFLYGNCLKYYDFTCLASAFFVAVAMSTSMYLSQMRFEGAALCERLFTQVASVRSHA